jgi:hypothetical protein
MLNYMYEYSGLIMNMIIYLDLKWEDRIEY